MEKITLIKSIRNVLILCFLSLSANISAVEFAGQITAGTYEISSAATLQLFQAFANGTTPYSGTKNCQNYVFNQTADIDLAGYAWVPIGNANNRFRGSYNGNNFTIRNLRIKLPTAPNGVGLFGFLEVGKLEKITVLGDSVVGNNYVGGLLGGMNGGTVDNCKTDIVVIGVGNIGGLIGRAEGNHIVSNSSATGKVEPANAQTNAAGGLIGSVSSGGTAKVFNCFATGNVAGKYQIGGFAGSFSGSAGGLIENCYATGNVTITTETKGGGFIGEISGSVTARSCYATGNVENQGTQGNYLGGFAGDIRESNLVHILCKRKSNQWESIHWRIYRSCNQSHCKKLLCHWRSKRKK
jgi:hypothetical protein